MQQQVMIDLVTAFIFLIIVDLVKLNRDFAVDGLERCERVSIVLLVNRCYRLYTWKRLSVAGDLAHLIVFHRLSRLVKVHT